MRERLTEMQEELLLAKAMIYFVFIGAATVAIALAAHAH
jgi:hypothetical protein